MKDITLKINGAHIYDNVEQEELEFVTEGKFHKKGDTFYLTYDESKLSGLEGCKTRLTLREGVVSMTRRGSSVGIDTEIRFEKGKRYTGLYDTEFGPVEMEVLTNELTNTVTPEGKGTVKIDYHISLKGFAEGRSKLNIEVR